MGKAVLISIRPEWCEKITSVEKTLEVRKNRPKQEAPFKCYIYRTKGTVNHIVNGKWFKMQVGGTVIGEFTCDAILQMSIEYSNPNSRVALKEFPGTCLTDKQIIDYLGNGVTGYGWHISNLKIYEKPKKLSDFRKPFPFHSFCKKCVRGGTAFHPETCYGCEHFENINITRPPQSWCYVEEVRLT